MTVPAITQPKSPSCAGHQHAERAGRLHDTGVDVVGLGALPQLVAQRVGLAVAQRDRDHLGDARRRTRRRHRRTRPTGPVRRCSVGGRSGAYWLAASAMSSTSSCSISTPGAGVEPGRRPRPASAGLKSRSSLTNPGLDSPSPYTSTRSGTPLLGVGPEVDVVDARLRRGRLDPQPGRAHPGDSRGCRCAVRRPRRRRAAAARPAPAAPGRPCAAAGCRGRGSVGPGRPRSSTRWWCRRGGPGRSRR